MSYGLFFPIPCLDEFGSVSRVVCTYMILSLLAGRGSPAVPRAERKGVHALPLPTEGIFLLIPVGVGVSGEAMK
uniref:Uncharacterized protein n=1 Tax=Oryza punctata TaxID=4537 RepID=A0A0E0LSP3_ORYPU